MSKKFKFKKIFKVKTKCSDMQLSFFSLIQSPHFTSIRAFFSIYKCSTLFQFFCFCLTNLTLKTSSSTLEYVYLIKISCSYCCCWYKSSDKIPFQYRDKICVYDEHPIAGRDIQCRALYSRSRYTTPFDD